MSMRKVVVEGKTFERKAGKAFLRIKGNGRVVDIPLAEYLVNEKGYTPRDAYLATNEGPRRPVAVTPADIVSYVHHYGWLSP